MVSEQPETLSGLGGFEPDSEFAIERFEVFELERSSLFDDDWLRDSDSTQDLTDPCVLGWVCKALIVMPPRQRRKPVLQRARRQSIAIFR